MTVLEWCQPMAVEWSDPPPQRASKRPALWPDRLAPCITQPGRWALVWETWNPNSARCAVTSLRRGRIKVPPGQWEFRSGPHNNNFGVWARYGGNQPQLFEEQNETTQ